jgi:hypothetical protein
MQSDRTSKNKHKLYVIYLQVLNVPPKFRSKVNSVFPLAIAYSSSLRNNMHSGLNILLKDFIDTINTLSTSGMHFVVNGELQLLRGRLVAFIGDSLAANAIGGFKEGFSANVKRCCRACNSTRPEMEDKSSAFECSIRHEREHRTRVN